MTLLPLLVPPLAAAGNTVFQIMTTSSRASMRAYALSVLPPSTTSSPHSLIYSPAPLSPYKRRPMNGQTYFSSSTALRSSTHNNSIDVVAEVTNSSNGSSSAFTPFLQSIDNLGTNLKPLALRAYKKSFQYSNFSSADNVNGTDTKMPMVGGNINRVKSILCRIKANVLWILYIIYRGYRGFFVILPVVFREVSRQLEESDLSFDVFDDGEEDKEHVVNADAEPHPQQRQQQMKLRTRVTISVLSGMLTMSYVFSGAIRVLWKFIKTFTESISLESSLEAAAAEVVVNEHKLHNKMK